MEEVLHYFLAPHEPTTDCDTFMDTHSETKEGGKLKSLVNSTLKRPPSFPPQITLTKLSEINIDEFSRYDSRRRAESNSPPPSYASETSIQSLEYDINRNGRADNPIPARPERKLNNIRTV